MAMENSEVTKLEAEKDDLIAALEWIADEILNDAALGVDVFDREPAARGKYTRQRLEEIVSTAKRALRNVGYIE